MSLSPLNTAGRILMATISTPDLQATQSLYSDCFRYKVMDNGKVSQELANSWAAPATAGKEFALLGPGREDSYALRLIQDGAGPEASGLRTYGWWALELSVEDVEQVHEAVKKSGFEVVGAPREMTFDSPVRPMQCAGPNGEVFFLTQVREHKSPDAAARAQTFVDQLFIVILGSPDREQALRFYEEALGLKRSDEFEIDYRSLNWAFGLPTGTTHNLTILDAGNTAVLQVDQYPDMAIQRKISPGYLPPNVSMVSFVVSSLDQVKADFLSDAVCSNDKPYNGRASAVIRGKAGELMELVEVG